MQSRDYLREYQENEIQLDDIPLEDRSEAIYLEAVKRSVNNLPSIPEDKRSEAIYLVVAKKSKQALVNIPVDKLTEKILLVAIEYYHMPFEEMSLPPALLTEAVCLAIVRQNWKALKHIPSEKQTKAICLAAIEINSEAVRYVALNDVKEREETYLATVQANGMALQYFYFSRTLAICLAAVKQNGEAVKFISSNEYPKEEMESIYLAAVTQNGLALRHIPEEKRSAAICLAAVKQNSEVVKLILANNYTDEEMESIYLAAVTQNGLALQHIPKEKRSEAICLAAVKQNGYALKDVPKKKHSNIIFMEALKNYGMALYFIPEEKQTDDMYLLAVTQDGLAIQYVPEEKRSEAICLAAVKQNGLALWYVPEKTEELCLLAVQQNVMALWYVPDAYKKKIIDTLTVKGILEKNYLAVSYFSQELDYKNEIDAFFAPITHVIINDSKFNAPDFELDDIEGKYSKNKTGKIISVQKSEGSEDDLNRLLSILQWANNVNPLHLALVDHANENSDALAELDYNEIANFCKQYSHIEYIRLLGCNVAKANMSAEEKKMIQDFSAEMKMKKELKYGFVTTLQAPLNEDAFQKKCIVFCKKNKLNGLYILNKIDDDHYQLHVIKCNETYTEVKKIATSNIPANRINQLTKILENQKKPLSFPKAPGNEFVIVRSKANPPTQDNASKAKTGPGPLSQKELSSLRALKYEAERFDRTHPKYQKDKATYPFLATMNTSVPALRTSLMEKIASTIDADDEIKQDVTIKGATKALHVDTLQQDYKVARTHLYKSSYRTSLFESKAENIHYDKLKDERQKEIEMMKEGNATGETMAKQIKVTVHKRNMA